MNKELKDTFYKKINNIIDSKTEINNNYKLIHIIEEDKETNQYHITAKIIIDKDSKMIEKCKKENTSPLTQALKKMEKEHKTLIKEGKTENKLYLEEK